MSRIAEKPGFMNIRAVNICAKAVTGRSQELKIRVFVQIFNKTKTLDSST